MIRIPKKILDELELRGKFVTLEISGMSLIITEVIPAIEKRISEKTTAQTIQKETIEEIKAKSSPKKSSSKKTVTPSSEEQPTPDEITPVPTEFSNEGSYDAQPDNKKSILDKLDAATMARLEQ